MKSIEERVYRFFLVAKHPMTPFLVRMWMNEREPSNHAKFPDSSPAYAPTTDKQVADACLRLMNKGKLKEVQVDGHYRIERSVRVYELV